MLSSVGVLLLFGCLLAVYLVVCVALAFILVFPPRLLRFKPPRYLAELEVAQSLCWFAEPAEGKPVFLLMHELLGSRRRWLPMAKRLTHDGFGVVLPAMVGHHGHRSRRCSFGLEDGKMTAEIVGWLRSRYPSSPIIVGGVSLGGVAAWLATDHVSPDAVFSEGAFATWEEALPDWFNMLLPFGYQFFWPTHRLARLLQPIEVGAIQPIRSAANWKGRPCGVFHGERDREFPIERGKHLAQAAGVPLWTIPRSGHVSGQKNAPDAYYERLLSLAGHAQRGVHPPNVEPICDAAEGDRLV